MLKVLGITRAYVQSIGTHEENALHLKLPQDYSDWRTIEAALLEEEHKKAKAITQMRRQQVI